MNLICQSKLYKLGNGLFNDWRLMGLTGWVSAADRGSISRVNFTFIVFGRGCYTLLAENPPIFDNDSTQNILLMHSQVGNIQLVFKHLSMLSFIIFLAKVGVRIVQVWGLMAALSYQAASLNLREQQFPLIFGVRVPTSIKQGANVSLARGPLLTTKNDLPTNQKGYNTFETTVGKLLAKKIQIFLNYLCKIHF